MTTRLQGFVVVLEDVKREDDAEVTLDAIKQIKGVADVKPIEDDHFAVMSGVHRERMAISDALLELRLRVLEGKAI